MTAPLRLVIPLLLTQLPPGWLGRADAGTPADLRVSAVGPGLRFAAGAAGIVWRAAERAPAPFLATASITQTRAGPLAGYGILIGGADLAGPAPTYRTFLIRPDGRFAITDRRGDSTVAVVPWTAHPAIRPADGRGNATNRLEVDGRGPRTRFLVNGKVVHESARVGDQTGAVGLRVGAGLALFVAEFNVR